MGLFSSPFLSPNSTTFSKSSPTRKSSVRISKPYPQDTPPLSPLFAAEPIADPRYAKPSRSQSTLTSDMFVGDNYWSSASQPLLSLDVAKRTESVVKRGFEVTHNKSQEYRLSSAINVGKDGFVWCGDRKVKGSNAAASACRDVKYDPCGDSQTKKILPRPPLVSLEDANRKEKVRRRKAAQEVMARKTAQERQAQLIERREALKKEQARLEELERMALEARRKEEELQRRYEAASLASVGVTPTIVSSKDHLVVGPTSWIVPLISLEDAKKSETARRQREDVEATGQTNPQAAGVASMDHLVINTAKGSTELSLVSLEEAKQRESIRRQIEEALDAAKSHQLMTTGAGTGLSHVPLVTLEEAKRRESIRRKKVENGKPTKAIHYRPVYQDDSESESDEEMGYRNAAGAQEKARWHNLMSRTNSWWSGPPGSFGFMNSGIDAKHPTWL